MRYDFHVHSTYSDGRHLSQMVRAAEAACLRGVGFADHCNVLDEGDIAQVRNLAGYNLDRTFDRRRQAIEQLREDRSIEIFDAVEMDFLPDAIPEIATFLEEANFDYVIGSVHHLAGENIHVESHYSTKSPRERRRLVDQYFDRLVELLDSDLFDIAAHPDLVERCAPLRGIASTDHYVRAAEAFEDSRTVPELNAGRILSEPKRIHPSREFIDILIEHGQAFAVGTDSHLPGNVGARVEALTDSAEYGAVDIVSPDDLR